MFLSDTRYRIWRYFEGHTILNENEVSAYYIDGASVIALLKNGEVVTVFVESEGNTAEEFLIRLWSSMGENTK